MAGELGKHERYEDAFASYEQIMRPYVESVQQLPPGIPRLAYPKTAFGVSVVNTVVGILASSPVQKLASVFNRSDAQEDESFNDKPLPDYTPYFAPA